MKVISVADPIYADAANRSIRATVEFDMIGKVLFLATDDDGTDYGPAIFHDCLDGKYGEVAPFVAPVVTKDQLAAYATAKQATIVGAGISVDVGSPEAPQIVKASTDAFSLTLLLGAAAQATQGGVTSFDWISGGAAVTLTAPQLLLIDAQVTAFIQSTFTACGAVLSDIAAGTIANYEAIDAFAWPANS
jgi:hypothetical protein